jgi:hypothetical protein
MIFPASFCVIDGKARLRDSICTFFWSFFLSDEAMRRACDGCDVMDGWTGSWIPP